MIPYKRNTIQIKQCNNTKLKNKLFYSFQYAELFTGYRKKEALAHYKFICYELLPGCNFSFISSNQMYMLYKKGNWKKPLTYIPIISYSLLVGTRIKGQQCYEFTGKHLAAPFITEHHQLELWFSAYPLLLKGKM